ncbi:GyrI-like domain-containing protein [Nocardioides salsibiostraticola]
MKVDFKKSLDSLRAGRGEFRVIDVPPQHYLMIDGHGDPNTAPAYAEAVQTLYPVAYTIKFTSKRELDRDYVVPPLEALWWAADLDAFTAARDKSQWDWTVMIMLPDWIPVEVYADAVTTAATKAPSAGLQKLRRGRLDEGRCVQTLHVGPYDDEAAVLAELHDHFIPRAGLRMTGKHHEIYLSDPRRVEPAKLRTILRQPVLQSP